MNKILLFLITILLLFPFGKTVFGQFNFQTNESISVEMIPEFPEPETVVILKIESYSFDLNSSNVVWYVRGKEVAKGIGLKKISFLNGKIGEDTTISIKVTTNSGGVVEKTFSVNSSTVDIIYEADTYTPPFFKGKPLFSIQSAITFIAIPHLFSYGKELEPEKLIYKWYKDGEIIDDLSGYGKNSIKLNSSILGRSIQMEVEASDPQSGNTAVGFVEVNPISPYVIFYEKDPLYGILFNKALGTEGTLTKKEVGLVAIPYFFSTKNVNYNLSYNWYMNGLQIEDYKNTNERLFRIEGDKEAKPRMAGTI
jgi:hypothetical protein